MNITPVINEDRPRVRLLVDRLHDAAAGVRAGRIPGDIGALLSDAAVLLDGYQAGIQLVTPHPATGYALVQKTPDQEAA